MWSNTPIFTVRRPAPELSIIEIQVEITARAESQMNDAYALADGPDEPISLATAVL